MMAMYEKLNTNEYNALSFERYRLQAEIAKLCYEIKEEKLGDPEYSNIKINELLSDSFVKKLCSKVDLNSVNNSKKSYVTSNPETVYLSVVDRDLNAVSFINSICHSFGSGITSSNSGILFQNRGVNFRLEKKIIPMLLMVEKDHYIQ